MLIFFGAGDLANYTLQAVEACQGIGKELQVIVVVSSSLAGKEEVLEKLKDYDVAVLLQPENFVDLMREADLFVGAGGTNLWERCYLGLPSLCLATVRNQESQIEMCSKTDIS